ncbi:bile acid:sodium symporter [Desulfobacterales bacterium HSG2]|nr:bile acid:sodium symporter [Desulfobacterales bacterium HSG2]
MHLIKKYWFLIGLLLLFAITIGDTQGTVSDIGKWLKIRRGPDTAIFLIFIFSGMMLNAGQIKSGMSDITGILVALGVIFIAAPVIGACFAIMPLDTGIRIGLFLVAVMPTTLSSGVVMTGAAGGNMAHALAITIVSNGLSILTIPLTLSLLLEQVDGGTAVSIDKLAIMTKLGFLVLVPLCLGLGIRFYTNVCSEKFESELQIVNQCLILIIVWMALSQTREAIIDGKEMIGSILFLAFAFHAALLACAALFIRLFKLKRGRRESVLFMGAQKTLTLSIILQVSLFPQHGLALGFCVIHHIVHLMMDGYLVQKMRNPVFEGE